MELVLLATRDITLSDPNASSHLKLDPLTSVARPGTGTVKSALLALKDGFSVPMAFVFQ